MKRRAMLSSAAAVALLAACGDRRTPGQARGPAATATQPAGGAPAPVRGGTLTAVMPRDAGNFDPVRSNDSYTAAVQVNVVDSLFEIDRDGNVVGRLVEKTDNPQPNEYVFTLRQGVRFHDGTALDAEAVRFNLQRHLDDPRSVRHQDVKDITAIETPDPSTVRITLKAPFAPFPVKLTFGAGYILSPAAVQRLGESLQRDLTGAGSGAFKFVEWKKDTHVVLERNPDYWKKDAGGAALPYLDRLVFKPFPDENVRLTNLRTGDADVLIGNPPYKDVQALKSGDDLVVKEIPGHGFALLILHTDSEPFNHPAARRALSYAIDRAQIRQTVFFDNGRALDTPVPEAIPWAYDPAHHPYLKRDLAKARQELAAAGRPSGYKFTLQIANNSPELQQTAELLKDQVREAGLELEIQLLEFGTVIANGSAGEFQALALGWSGDVDPDTLNSLFATGAGFNYTRYGNPQLDALLAEGRTTLDRARRGDLYKAAQRLLLEDQPALVYFNPPQISTVRKAVQNYPQTYNGYWGARDFDTIWKTQ